MFICRKIQQLKQIKIFYPKFMQHLYDIEHKLDEIKMVQPQLMQHLCDIEHKFDHVSKKLLDDKEQNFSKRLDDIEYKLDDIEYKLDYISMQINKNGTAFAMVPYHGKFSNYFKKRMVNSFV